MELALLRNGCFAVVLAIGWCLAAAQDAVTLQRIDAFLAQEVAASGLPGVALAIVRDDRSAHVRGFGQDGHGKPITGDTPFPVGSLTKSIIALLVRQVADEGRLDVDAPVRSYLPTFALADAQATSALTVRHLLNQTSGFSRADGIAPLLTSTDLSADEFARGLKSVSVSRAGERFEYSNLNYALLGVVLHAVTRRSWRELVQQRVLSPLGMRHSYVDHDEAQREGMTQVHQIVFGVPIEREIGLPSAFEPTGGLVASANDMVQYLRMLLAGGHAESGSVVSAQSVAQLLTPASPPGRSTLLSADFDFRYGEGWFVGPFGAAPDARWHLGSLMPFAAWMVMLPDTKQAVVVLINANTELPLGNVNAVMSRLPIGVVNLLRGHEAPSGPSLRTAYANFSAVIISALGVLALLAWRGAHARRSRSRMVMAAIAVSMPLVATAAGVGPMLLWVVAPELAIAGALAIALLAAPLVWSFVVRART